MALLWARFLFDILTFLPKFKAKVELLHQFRVRSLQSQLTELRKQFHAFFTACEARLPRTPSSRASAAGDDGPQTQAMADLLENQ